MPRIFKHLFAILFVIIVVGCSGGGGCGGGCASCGVTPLAEGFKPSARVENAAGVRLTDKGLQFLEANLSSLASTLIGGGANGGVVTFEVPQSGGSQFGIDYTICPGGADPNASPPKCTAEVDIGNAQLNIAAAGPHNIKITGPLPIRLQKLPIDIVYLFIPDSSTVVINGDGSCPNNPQAFANVDLDVDISIEVDQNQSHSRVGYTRVRITKADVNKTQLEDSLGFCGGGFTSFVLNAVKGFAIDLFYDQLIGTLKENIESQLCQQANPMLDPTCPTGTNDVNGVCRYGTTDGDECASIILGMDGHADLGSLLASISPGTKGGLDILLAAGGQGPRNDGTPFAWGDLNPINGGASLGMYGGAEPTPISKCVPLSNIAMPEGIPFPDELVANDVAGWPVGLEGPHVGIALSERFTNYALSGMYNSGLLCLGISTESQALLNSGTFGLLAASMKDLGLQHETQQVALVVRPQSPPTATFGNGTNIDTDPVIRVKMPNASFDFYIWSLDRFIRFMTATFDLDIPVNLTVTPEGLVPVIDKIGVDNGVVTNSELLREDPQTIADALGSLIASQVGQAVGGGISPIDLNSSLASLGLTLTIPESVEGQGSPGLRKLTKDNDNYLGIFATLATAQQMAQIPQAETSAVVTGKIVDRAGLRFTTINKDNAPEVTLALKSSLDDGTHLVEWQYRIDQGAWHPWSQRRFLDVQDDWLRVQGRHKIAVRSRIVGEPMSVDPTPAVAEVVIDIEPPTVTLGDVADGVLELRVEDSVSPEATLVRTRLDGGAWSAWVAASEVARLPVGEADDIEIEAKDEEGNVVSTQQAIIRGRAPADAAAGCNCSVPGGAPGGGSNNGVIWLLGATIFGVASRFFKRTPRPVSASAVTRRTQAARTVLGAAALVAVTGAWSGCSCSDETSPNSQGGYDCQPPTCTTLQPGLVGAYTSTAVSGKTIWVAGYAEADWNNDYTWGDLVVGKWNGSVVEWVAVDGVPTEPIPDEKAWNKNGFRGGQTDPGEDVGLWTSIAIDGAGNPAVAYYDRTHKGLRLAAFAAEKWTIQTVEQKDGSDIGRYAKLLFIDGKPTIAYLLIEPGMNGAITSKVRVATGSAGSWTFEDAVVEPATPCRKQFCQAGTECVAATGLCTTALADATCQPECASGTACVDQGGSPGCVDVLDKTKLDSYPDAVGDYVTIAPDGKGGIGIAYYDRIHGNLAIASKSGGAWTTQVIDGEAAGVDNGDVGMGASLFIDGPGDWHVSYVDGYDETVRYIKVTQGTTAGAFSVVDDGLGFGPAAPFDDGHHIIGDDSKITVTPGGEIHITYQDATSGKLRHAVGSAAANPTWTLSEVETTGFSGAFSSQVEVDGALQLVTWWRVGGAEVKGDVAIVSP